MAASSSSASLPYMFKHTLTMSHHDANCWKLVNQPPCWPVMPSDIRHGLQSHSQLVKHVILTAMGML